MLSRDGFLTAGDTITDLRDYIAASGLKPGERLPAERALTAELGVTRNTLRKALDALEREGTIWRHVGKGTFVAATADDLDRMTQSPAELGKQLTPFRMMRARLAIEPAIAREAAINASGDVIARLKATIQRMRAATSWKLYETEDDVFHREVAEASDNLLLLSVFDQLNMVRRAVAWGAVMRQSSKPPADHGSFAEHEEIVQSIINRDPAGAHEAMRKHLRSVAERLFGEI
ncbi:FadR/GntR family transcriptional regulator [Hoeflea sp. YIM 152468]|uniref:FadR/GntR family transcriptional regulator n=1 Tax=Hoeflea sp. YIM 152468 TaxID=3031759 RepID=UPI0023DC923D|nr:FadR/GntR family transcriptional regulator [Hoeflea sp. YIM 152468]MDF1608823.1 FadR/GntR family transcriptional regulator [Hoeflea sp. YIM 152468]